MATLSWIATAKWTDDTGKLTPDAARFIGALIRSLPNIEENIDALEQRIIELESQE